ncbi:MAG: glycosyltransferase family 4 protein [Archangium sp.]
MAQIHQLLPNFTPADAMGQCAVAWQRVLRHLGFNGELYADDVAPQWRSLVRPASELRPAQGDLVLYHHGIASPLAGRLMHFDCRRAVVFHNVTPAHFYAGTRLAEPLIAGRAQLAALAEFVEFSIGVSEFNARELRAAGHTNVSVVPLFVEPERFAPSVADQSWLSRFRDAGRPRVVSVSRVVPHKRMEDLLALHSELRRIAPRAELWIVGGYAPGNAAFKKLAARAKEIGGVTFLGRVSHSQLVAAYRSADVFVSMSEHEGFGVPLIEAMACELPVLAYGAAAVPETMGGAGIVFDEKNFAALAEVVQLVTTDQSLRESLITGQRRRVAELSFENSLNKMSPLLREERVRVGSRKPRVAIVVQRFGETLTGGAEAHAREVAQRLSHHAHVEVLTTCAKDHLTWKNEFPEGVEEDEGLTVRRFPVRRPRAMRPFNRLSDSLFNTPQDFVAETHWLAEQGPDSPALLDAIASRRDDFDAFIFFTYLYAPTVWGVPLVADKALVVPTAHDEPPLRFGAMSDVFEAPRALLCNTPEELQLIEKHFPNVTKRRVVGVGIEPKKGKPERFREQFGIDGPYLLYLGRMEAGKGVLELAKRHQSLVGDFHDAPTLVLAGSGEVAPRGRRIVSVGRIDDEAKWDALSGALAVVVPSRYESLSLLTLEAFAVGTPVLGNEACAVVKGQLERSGGGLTFDLSSDQSYRNGVQQLGSRREVFGDEGRHYAAGVKWERVVDAYLQEIELIRRDT